MAARVLARRARRSSPRTTCRLLLLTSRQGPAPTAIDRAFLARLPTELDPCGEFGEFHSFVHDGPLFRTPIKFVLDPPRALERVIATTDGPRRFTYWLTTPRELESANA